MRSPTDRVGGEAGDISPKPSTIPVAIMRPTRSVVAHESSTPATSGRKQRFLCIEAPGLARAGVRVH